MFADVGSAYGRTRVDLDLGASTEHGIYEGLHVKITAGKEEGEMVSIIRN